MMNNIIEATILNGKFKGEDVLLPRIPMIPTDMSIEFKRLQFPVQQAFAMIINKAQEHRYKCVDIVWKIYASHISHGQLYTYIWLAHALENLLIYSYFVYTPEGKTKNIVYSKALQ
jgi:ATP-dependent DNA helicase PIF1